MKSFVVESSRRSEVHIGLSLEALGAYLPKDALIVIDMKVLASYGKYIKKYKILPLVATEDKKNMETIEQILHFLAASGANRQTTLVAIGGGIIGDLAGFAASIYQRGIHLIQVPTTLLSMIDSSVGGKTGINMPFGKNQVGSFYPGDLVLIAPAFLDTLERQEIDNGFGELIKYALLSTRVYDYVQGKNRQDLLDTLEELIYHCLSFKKQVVEEDEREGGRRMILNLGHTYGHAIELAYGLKHGISVLHGLGFVLSDDLLRIRDQLIQSLALDFKDQEFSPRLLTPYLQHDKKKGNGAIRLVCLEKLGEPFIKEVSYE